MAEQGTLSANGSTDWFVMTTHGHVHIKCVNDFGGGTVTIQDQVNGTAYSTLDGSGVAIAKTAAFDEALYFGAGDRLRLTLSGATLPTIFWKLTGPIKKDF